MTYDTIKAALEAADHVAAVVVGIAALFGLRSLRLTNEQLRIAAQQLEFTREITAETAKRDAAKLAIEQCRYYAEVVNATGTTLLQEMTAAKTVTMGRALATSCANPAVRVLQGKIEHQNVDKNLVEAEIGKLPTLVDMMNKLEAFAVLFSVGLADDEIGYRETGIAFLQWYVMLGAAFLLFRERHWGRFESSATLFERWHRRMYPHCYEDNPTR